MPVPFSAAALASLVRAVAHPPDDESWQFSRRCRGALRAGCMTGRATYRPEVETRRGVDRTLS